MRFADKTQKQQEHIPTRKEVVTKLSKLPTESNAIAAVLVAYGIKGKRGRSQSCPIACYLGKYVTVGWSKCYCLGTGLGPIFLPDAVSDFIAGFDAGLYPALEER